jgi:hypothetical protein
MQFFYSLNIQNPMNISNLLTVSAAVTIAVAGTIYSKASDPVINYYAITPSGCVSSSNPGCTTTVGQACTIQIDGVACQVKRQADAGSPCAVTLYKN